MEMKSSSSCNKNKAVVVALLLVLFAEAAAAHPEAADHKCGSQWPYCGGGRCCSKGGYCGSSDCHCCVHFCAYQCPKHPRRNCPSPETLPSSSNYYFSNITSHDDGVAGKRYPGGGAGDR
ncbi:unnamed protein product [Linum trigynum]|uniref:Chitin-binding type-1 domain-containing protein n=1 Tax=Linum trigynum TaxID=586398 RepID=A0AAV2DLH5_9ROSI